MKKVVISLLILLPFVLIVVISFAGKIFGDYSYIEVQGISFLDEHGDVTAGNPDYVLTLDIDEPQKLSYRITPANASNQGVNFTVIDDTICVVTHENDGYYIKGLQVGQTRVRVSTYNNHTSEINVSVEDRHVRGVTLDRESISGIVGNSFKLNANVYPATATNKDVVWTTTNSNVCTVAADGTVRFIGAGNATVIVTTVDGGYYATCAVTVTEEGLSFIQSTVTITERTIDLAEYINGELTAEARIAYDADECTLDGTILTLKETTSITRVQLIVGDNISTMTIIYRSA